MGVSRAQTVHSAPNAVRVTIFMLITHAQPVQFSAKHAKITFAQAAKCSISSMLEALTVFFVSPSYMHVSHVPLTQPASTVMKVST
jgi:hypothetical protein